MFVQFVQKHVRPQSLATLFDPGSSKSYFHRRCLPSGAVPTTLSSSHVANTAAGPFHVRHAVNLQGLSFPEFSKSMKFEELQCGVFDEPNCQYDVILGRDFLSAAELDIKYSTHTMEWQDRVVPMKTQAAPFSLYVDFEDEDDLDDLFATQEILDRKYEQVDLDTVVDAQTHLSNSQQVIFRRSLEGHDVLFNGKLGKYPKKKVHLDLEPDSKPVHCRPYPVPRKHEAVFKKECDELCRDGVLEPVGTTEHAYPTFIVPKKDGRVRWVSDFRKLNAQLRRSPYPLPRIQDILTRRSGYTFFTKIDISMQYYTFELDDESANLCIIVTPFGKYRYKRLPMGIKTSPDIAQQVMEDILRDLDFTEVYFDDIGIFGQGSFEDHMRDVNTVLGRLQDNGFTVNPLKCEWAVQETDWLGYWLTPTGIKPWAKKINALKKLKPPTTIKQLRSFIGAVNYYRDMWPHRSHILAPLTDLTGTNKFVWESIHQQAFERMVKLLSSDALLAYPDHNKPFHIYTDASDFQLGAVIKQDGRPVAYYSRKLNSAQRNYTTIEKELLSIVATLQEFRSMLFGAELHIHTDHRNLTHFNFTTQRVLRWRLYIEEYSPHFHYVRGTDNVLADFLSRSPLTDGDEDDFMYLSSADLMFDPIDDFMMSEPDVFLDCFLNEPFPRTPVNPIDYATLQTAQQAQHGLTLLPQHDPIRYSSQPFGQTMLVCYRPPGTHNFRIVVPDAVLLHLVRWYHSVLGHTGEANLQRTLQATFHHRNIRATIADVVKNCAVCQRNKLANRGFGNLPPREANVAPWFEVAVDTIGPWTVRVRNQNVQLYAVTIIDTATNLVELVRISSPTAARAANAFEHGWLFRYPRPVRVVHDQGSEYQGQEFAALLQRWGGIDNVPISVRNPQANAICERMHQVVGNVLRTLLYSHPPQNIQGANDLVDYALATASHALRSSCHRTMGLSPGAVVFHRDMLIDIPFVADMLLLRDNRQALIDYNLRRENNRRRTFDCQIGQRVLEHLPKPAKLGLRTRGPYRIEQVHTNGTLTIRRTPALLDRVNIRRLRPYLHR